MSFDACADARRPNKRGAPQSYSFFVDRRFRACCRGERLNASARAELAREARHQGRTMNVFVQNATCPSQVLFAFDDIANAQVVSVRWAVAYSTRRGCDRLVRRVSARMGTRQWERSQKHFV